MTARGFFITGTNTDVGKTIVTRAITGALVRRGHRAVALKPVESGASDGPADAMALSNVSYLPLSSKEVSTYTFRDPVSPHLAAEREGRPIDSARILQFLDQWTERAEVVIAEGAGGLLVPLSYHVTYADLIATSQFELIIVSPNILGTINATLLTIEAARARDIPVLGVILNGNAESDLGNREAIAAHGGVTILGEFPRVDSPEDGILADIAETTLDLDRMMGIH